MSVICVVKDLKSGLFMKPFAIQSIVDAEREFRQVAEGKHGPSMIQSYPEDFCLLKIGEFEEENGELFPCEAVIILKGTTILYEREKKGEPKNETKKQ